MFPNNQSQMIALNSYSLSFFVFNEQTFIANFPNSQVTIVSNNQSLSTFVSNNQWLFTIIPNYHKIITIVPNEQISMWALRLENEFNDLQ